ncbi:MAG TPA: hypothetical protein LFV92_07345 [Rickettsia endosymbiont of Ceroptres masudai]|nr:hypothetical protein [Rickettsia endosymbiont of Ceroptres masudai]
MTIRYPRNKAFPRGSENTFSVTPSGVSTVSSKTTNIFNWTPCQATG